MESRLEQADFLAYGYKYKDQQDNTLIFEKRDKPGFGLVLMYDEAKQESLPIKAALRAAFIFYTLDCGGLVLPGPPPAIRARRSPIVPRTNVIREMDVLNGAANL